jgi:glycosyltransferase involved in cell wall biosynthesis
MNKQVIKEINNLIANRDYKEALDKLISRKNDINALLYKQKLDELTRSLGIGSSNKNTLVTTRDNIPESLVECIIDISDLVNYISSGSRTVTGIQRLILACLNELDQKERGRCQLISLHDYEKRGCLLLDWKFIDYVVEFVGGTMPVEKFDYYLERYLKSLPPFNSMKSNCSVCDVLLIMGACWIVPSFPESHSDFAKKNNLKVASIFYDLIPYTHPDFVSSDASSEFYLYFMALLSISDILVPISSFVGKEIQRNIAHFSNQIPKVPLISPIPLASQIAFENNITQASEFAEKDYLSLDKLQKDNFVLCVGSVEIRKNHISLFVAWRYLEGILGDNCPQLVVVGKFGWKAESFFDALDRSANLNDKIIVITGVADATLRYLYANCRFTVYPSLDEGWGLPIGESLHAGKVCVTSNVASMPEVGKDLAVYINPSDPYELADKCLELIQNPGIVDALEAKIQDSRPLRSWADYKVDLAHVVSALRLSQDKPVNSHGCNNIYIPPGRPITLYWHLGYLMKDFPLGLSPSHRSIQQIAASRLAIKSTSLLAYEIDGCWIRGNNLDVSFYLRLEDPGLEDSPSYRAHKISGFRVVLHYFADLSVPTPIKESIASLELGSPSIINTNNFHASSSTDSLYDLPKPVHTSRHDNSFDCASFGFEMHSPICISDLQSRYAMPVRFNLQWNFIDDCFINIGDNRVTNLKIKEFLIEINGQTSD